MFEVRVTAGPQQEGSLDMAERRQGCNDHDRRKAAIVRLAAKIGMALCKSDFRPLSESAWVRLQTMRLELDALRAEAGV
jgi:hypothetical protein